MSTVVDKVETYTNGPKEADFTKDELKLIDIDGLQRNYLKITFKQLTDEVYFTLRDITKCQYVLPVKYLHPVPGSYSYVSQKSQIFGKEKDIKNAGVTIEPLNPDIFNLISYTPINQSIPTGTIVTLDVSIPFDTLPNGEEPERQFIWSYNLKTDNDIEDKIKSENPKSIRTKPWIDKCHYCTIDIGSRVTAKYEVASVDTEIIRSFSLFGFSRCDDVKEFTIWSYKCFNVLPKDVLVLIKNMDIVDESSKKIIDEVLSKVK
jgi:hypothetical protein